MIKKILTAILLLPTLLYAQINTERVMTIARNALYFEDYVLSIQYFNQVINAKPYLYFLSLLYHIIWLNLFLYGFHLISAVCLAFQHGIQFSFNHLLA